MLEFDLFKTNSFENYPATEAHLPACQNTIWVCVIVCVNVPLGVRGAYQLCHTWKESRGRRPCRWLCTQEPGVCRLRPADLEIYPHLWIHPSPQQSPTHTQWGNGLLVFPDTGGGFHLRCSYQRYHIHQTLQGSWVLMRTIKRQEMKASKERNLFPC